MIAITDEMKRTGTSVDDAQRMQKPAPDDAIVLRPEEKKAA
jgi:hypothetical protein